MVEVAGLHLSPSRRIPFWVCLNSKSKKDSYPQFNTVLIKKGSSWELVEIASRAQDEEEIEECEEETTVVCFFHQSSDESMDFGAVIPAKDSIALRPELKKKSMAEKEKEESRRRWLVWAKP